MRIRNVLLAASVALAIAIPASAKEVVERYRGFAVSMGTVATGAKSAIKIGVYRYTTDEERANFQKVLETEGPQKLNELFYKSEEVAFLQIGSSMAYELRFARKYEMPDGSTKLIFAADRPIGFREAARNDSRTKEHNFTIIELNLPKEGKGEGLMAVGVEVKWDATKNQLILESYSTEPARIMEVMPFK